MKTKTLNPKQKAYLKENKALQASAKAYDKAINNLRKVEKKMNRKELLEAIEKI